MYWRVPSTGCGPDEAEGDSVTGSPRRALLEKKRTVVSKLGSYAAVDAAWASGLIVRAEGLVPVTVTDASTVSGSESGAYTFSPFAIRAGNVTHPRSPGTRMSPCAVYVPFEPAPPPGWAYPASTGHAHSTRTNRRRQCFIELQTHRQRASHTVIIRIPE